MTARIRKVVQPKDDGKVFGIGEDFAPDFPPEEGFWGWYIWRMSDKKHLPTLEEVRGLNKEWVSEIFFYETLAEWVTNDSPLMGMLAAKPEGGQGEILTPIVPQRTPEPTQ